ncbi:MAG: CBS domain-containing protein [Spirochaetia bacterium]|nr:CBS domain-containing protein [Spirochaetia bacterium]
MSYHALKFSKLQKGHTFHKPDHLSHNSVKLVDPAISVMTDLKEVQAITATESLKIDDALKVMIEKGVRMLFVVDLRNDIIGLITTNDISGEKPVQLSSQTGVLRSEIQVKDIMIPVDKIDIVEIKDVSSARVGDIVETLKSVNRRHVIVVDNQGTNNAKTIRGIFSMTKIEKQLGLVPAIA